jgi:hypothetical protein
METSAVNILSVLVIALFVIGAFILVAGIIILIRCTMSKEIRTLATQTSRLAQKGILDGVAGLVGNASTLLNATNQLVRTTAGIGVFLVIIGLGLIGASLFVLTKIPGIWL